MADDRNSNDQDSMLDPEDVNSAPRQSSREGLSTSSANDRGPADEAPLDANDEIPVPIAMSPAEIDERAQAVEALREAESRGSVADDPNLRS